MLRFMREFARSWFVKTLLLMVVVTFIGFFGWSAVRSPFSRDVVATVEGEAIGLSEYQEAYRRTFEVFRRIYGTALDDELISKLQIGKRALEGLVETKVQLIEARRAGLEVSDAEVARAIRGIPEFQREGRFDQRLYLEILRQNRILPEAFEAGQRQALLVRKMENLLLDGVRLLPAELEEAYLWSRERVKVRYVRLPAEELASSIRPDEKAIEAFYGEHKEEFRVPRKVKVGYYFADLMELEGQVEVKEEEVARTYEDQRSEFQRPERRHARHILFKVAPQSGPEEISRAREKAEAVLKEIQAGGDFSALAKTHSDDPNREMGGDLGAFSRGELDPAFEKVAFEMKEGEVRGPVQSRFGFHLIKLEKIEPEATQELKEVKATISDILRSTRAAEKARDLIDRVWASVDEGRPFEAFPETPGLKRGTSSFFSAAGEDLPLPDRQAVAASAFRLKKGEVGEPLEGQGGWYLLRLLDEEASRIPPVQEIRSQVEKAWLRAEGAKRAAERAKEAVAAIEGGKSLEEVAEGLGLAVKETPLFRRADPLPDLNPGREFYRRVFRLEEKKAAEVAVDGDRLVFVLAERKPADLSELSKEGEEFRKELLRDKQRVIYRQWLENVRGRANVNVKPGLQL